MKDRRNRTAIGKDKYGLNSTTYYTCKKGYCSEIYNVKCERRCTKHTHQFDMTDKNSVILTGEKVITTKCLNRYISDETPLNEVIFLFQNFCKMSRVFLQRQIWIVNYNVKS